VQLNHSCLLTVTWTVLSRRVAAARVVASDPPSAPWHGPTPIVNSPQYDYLREVWALLEYHWCVLVQQPHLNWAPAARFTKGRKRLSVVRWVYDLYGYSPNKSYIRSVANSVVNLRHHTLPEGVVNWSQMIVNRLSCRRTSILFVC